MHWGIVILKKVLIIWKMSNYNWPNIFFKYFFIFFRVDIVVFFC